MPFAVTGTRLLAVAALLATGCGGNGGKNVDLRVRILKPSDIADPYAGLATVRISVRQGGVELGFRIFDLDDEWALPSFDADLSQPLFVQMAGLDSTNVVVMNGRTASIVPDVAEKGITYGLFFAPPDDFALSPSPIGAPRISASAVVLADRRVLVAGGDDAVGDPVASIELYDSDTGTWAAMTDLAQARKSAGIAQLADGRVLIAGGEDAAGGDLLSAELFTLPTAADPDGSIAPAADLQVPWRDMLAARLPSGKILLAGGRADLAVPRPQVYDPVTNTWDVPATGQRAESAGVVPLPDGRVALVGGEDAGGILSRVDFVSESGGTVTVTPNENVLRVPRTRVSAAPVQIPGGAVSILVAAGASNTALTRDTAAAELVSIASPPVSAMSDRLLFHRSFRGTAVLGDGRVLIAGGNQIAAAGGNAEVWDPATGQSERTGGANNPLSGLQSAISMPDGTAMIASSNEGGEVEIYNPPVGPLSGSTRTPFTVTLTEGTRGGGASVLDGAERIRVRLYDFASLVEEKLFTVGGTSLDLGSQLVDDDPLHMVVQALDDDAGGQVIAWGGTVGGGLDEAAQGSGAKTILLGRTDEFVRSPNDLPSVHGGGAGVLLGDGRVMFAGGDGAGSAETEFFDASNGNSGTLGTTIPTARRDTQSAVLAGGDVLLLIGGLNGAGNPTGATSFFDTLLREWITPSPQAVPVAVRQHTVTVLGGDDVFLYGNNDGTTSTAAAFRRDDTTAQWTAIPMATPDKRSGHGAARLSTGNVLVTGGITSNGTIALSAGALLYDATGNTIAATGPLLTARRDHAAFSIGGGEAVVCGGHAALANTPQVASCERFANGAFTALATSLAVGRHDMATVRAPDGRVFMIGGGDGGATSSRLVDMWNPTDQTVVPAPSLVDVREEAIAVYLPDGRIVVAGGEDDGAGTNLDSIEILTPGAWTNPFGY